MATRQGILLGRIVDLDVRTPQGDVTVKVKNRFLGYLPGSKQLVVLKKTCKNPAGGLSGSVHKLHQRFHNAPATKIAHYEWPDPSGRKKTIGLLVALTYSIPKGLRSPTKSKCQWNHEFGDHGERGHGPVGESGGYPEKYMPALEQDEAGNLYIKRRPGNKFYVTDWLYW